MKSQALGKSILDAEVLSISNHGIWLIAHGREYFLPFDEFPWFKEANIAEILDVQLLHGFHLHWPSLDIDIDLESIDRIEEYRLVYK